VFKSGIDQAKGRLACGSMVFFCLFHKNIAQSATFLPEANFLSGFEPA